MLIHILALLIGFAGMEAIAWLTHRYVMHGFLWSLHKSHHQKGRGFFELNDFYFLFFASLGIGFMLWGAASGYDWKLYLGIGIALYGFTYLIVHDIIIHQRIRYFTKLNSPYITALRKAHKDHHRVTDKDGAVSFGMLLVHPKYFSAAKAQRKMMGHNILF